MSLFPFSRGYINHFFAKIVNPDMEQEEEDVQVKAQEKYEEDVFDEELSPEVLAERFVKYGFAKDEESIKKFLADKTFYIISPDGSAFIRRIDGEQHVEGYMATDKALSNYRQKWFYTEEDEAILGLEIAVEGQIKPLTWYLYFKKVKNVWKLYMLENE
jgi:hypothetical protein